VDETTVTIRITADEVRELDNLIAKHKMVDIAGLRGPDVLDRIGQQILDALKARMAFKEDER